MTNQGFELNLSADIIRCNDWTWNVSGVLGYNKNKVTYVNVEAPVSYLVIDYLTAYPRIGVPYNAIYGYQWAGLSAKGTPQVYDAKGNLFTDMTPTEIEDLVYLGTTVPIYTGSVNTNLHWKNWELAAQFAFEGGHKMRNTNVAYLSGMSPVSKRIADLYDFILNDLNEAIDGGLPQKSMTAIHPNLGAAYALKARFYLQMSNFPEALKYANLALEQNNAPYDWNAYYNEHREAIEDPTNYTNLQTPMDYSYVENY